MQSEQPPMHAETLSIKSDLSYGDGFRFGCGFMAAFLMFWVVLIIVGGAIAGLAFIIAPGLSTFLLPR